MNQFIMRITTMLLVLVLGGATQMASAGLSPQATGSGQSQQDATTPVRETDRPSDANSATTQNNSNNNDPQALPDSPSAAQSANQQKKDQDQNSQEPQGTAAARTAKTQGGAASKPAGAAIAPAKQKQTRSLLIKLGIIAGAGAALGTVYALSKGSPSRPPGAH